MKTALLITLLSLLAGPLPLGADEDLEVTPRKEPAQQPEPTNEQVQALLKRISVSLPAGAHWEESELAKALAAGASKDLEIFFRLLLPPSAPHAAQNSTALARARAAAVLGLSRDRRALQPLLNSAVYDPEELVREVAAQALALLQEPVALRKLVDLAIAADYQKYPWAVRKSACAALKRYGDKEAIERLLRELSYELAGGNFLDPKNKPRGVAQGLGTDNPLVLPHPSGPTDLHLSEHDMYPVLSALKEVSGKSFGADDKNLKAWQAWWKKEQDKFEFK